MSATNFWFEPKLHPFLLSILPTSYLMCSLSTFCTKWSKIRDDLDLQTSVSPIHDDPYIDAVLDAFQPVSEEHVRNVGLILKSVPKTCSLDPIPTFLFVELFPAVTHVINSSLVSGVFPSEFKTAVVKTLLKKPSLEHNNLKNYRPVSNLSFLSKILEKSFCLNSLPTSPPSTCYAPPCQPTVQGTALRRHYWKWWMTYCVFWTMATFLP